MEKQVILALVDGMRPDGMDACGHPFFQRMKRQSSYCLDAQTITRPITLPAHVSLFTGVDQHKHEVVDNVWHDYPQKYPGIIECVSKAGKKAAALVTWGPLCFLAHSNCLEHLDLLKGDYPERDVDDLLQFERNWTERCLKTITSQEYDFIFFYFEMADVIGHRHGWMSEPYLQALRCAGDCLEKILDSLAPEQHMILMADHGGSGTSHRYPDNPFDMTIPIFLTGSSFEKGAEHHGWHLLDVAPTVSKLLELETPEHYQGKSLL